MDDRAGYTIAGGATDADRLARMSTVMADSTLTFLRDAGLAAGASCLDVGCRDGQVALDMAREVGASGRVVGIDADGDALGIARRAAREAAWRRPSSAPIPPARTSRSPTSTSPTHGCC